MSNISSSSSSKMSTSAYYNFITTSADKTASLLPVATHKSSTNTMMSATEMARRRSAMSSPFANSSSFSSSASNTSSHSSLNQFNSLTQTSTRNQHHHNQETSSSSSPSSSHSSVASSTSAANQQATMSDNSYLSQHQQQNQRNQQQQNQQQRDLYRKSSMSSPHSATPPQLFHSYTLHSLEPKPFKPFKTKSDYIEAMKEDLAEWLGQLYPDLDLTPENLFSQLETGAIICRHANNVTLMGRNLMQDSTHSLDPSHNSFNESSYGSINEPSNNNNNNNQQNQNHHHHHHHRANSNSPMSSASSNDFSISSSSSTTTKSSHTSPRQSIASLSRAAIDINWFWVKMIPYKENAKPGTFFARDNICQFILWCRSLNILECLLFETDDLVARKNEKSFILCLLEVARIGFKVGMPTPLIIQLEQEIDREIEEEAKLEAEKQQNQSITVETTASRLDGENDLDGSSKKTSDDEQENARSKLAEEQQQLDIEKKLETSLDDEHTKQSEEVEEEDVEEEEEDYGPKPQVITNDLVSLHEKVVQLLCQCTCPTQFPMVRVGDNGKYKIGDKLIIFVRILRRHIMVRVGGGWQELSEFLRAKDPCRSKLNFNHTHHHHHHSTVSVSPSSSNHHNNNNNNNHHHGSQTIRQQSFSAAPRSRLQDNGQLFTSGNRSTTSAAASTYNSSSGIGTGLSRATVQRANSPASNPNHRHRFISGSASMSWISNNS